MRALLTLLPPVCLLALSLVPAPCSAQPDGDTPNGQTNGRESNEVAKAAGATDPGPVETAEFLAFLERVLPRKGSFIAVYEPVNPKAYGRGTLGFDAATGAWFAAGSTETGGSGRDPEGRDFMVEPRKGSARPGAGTPGPPPTEGYFPSAVLYFLAAHPEAVRSVGRTPEGGWMVSWQRPEDLNGHQFPLAFIEVASDGIPVKGWQDQPNDRREETFVYAPKSPPGFPLLNDPGMAPTHIEYFPEGNLTPFSQGSVAATCYDNSVIVQMKEQAIAAGVPRGGQAGSEKASVQTPVPFSGRNWDRLRWPLVLAGAILVGLAGIEVYRRRTR